MFELEKSVTRIRENFEAAGEFTATKGKGITRLPFTPEIRQCADFIKQLMEAAHMQVHMDAAGNIIGKYIGSDPSLPPILIGSHYDSVQNGGNFDGMAGILVGIEVVRILRESGKDIKRTIEVLGFCDEEGARFQSGFFGSKAMLGQLDVPYLKKYQDSQGISIYDAMQSYGLQPDKIMEARRDLTKAGHFFEMHIEQGPVLDSKSLDLGIVEGIVGIERDIIRIKGRADHAGTTPMDMRIDAMEIAGEVISKISKWAREKQNGTVATIGYVEARPGAINIIPEEVAFSIDIRSINIEDIDDILSKINTELNRLCEEAHTSYKVVHKLTEAPLKLDAAMQEKMKRLCQKYGYSYGTLPSGAGHDCMTIGRVIPSNMLFVPSRGGRSHCKEEWTDYEYIGKAIHILSELFLELVT